MREDGTVVGQISQIIDKMVFGTRTLTENRKCTFQRFSHIMCGSLKTRKLLSLAVSKTILLDQIRNTIGHQMPPMQCIK